MLRDPKDVAVVWSGKTFYGSVEDTRNQMADLIRARDREVIAEAKRVVEGLRYVGFPEMLSRPCVLAALDDILKEE